MQKEAMEKKKKASDMLKSLCSTSVEAIERYYRALNAEVEGEDMDLKREIAELPEAEQYLIMAQVDLYYF